jgi:two-component system, cell cycle sensor histidine kinase and response regulator CckA
MKASQVATGQNHIASRLMMDRSAQQQPNGVATATNPDSTPLLDPSDELGTAGGIQLTIIVTLATAVILALIASQDSQPLLLTVLALLSLLGTFFLFGVAAGHIRISERVTQRDLLNALADGVDEGVLVTELDGRPLYANTMVQQLLGYRGSLHNLSIEMAFQSRPETREAIYRLTRSASRGEPWREDVLLDEGSARARGHFAQTLRHSRRRPRRTGSGAVDGRRHYRGTQRVRR